MSLTPLEQAALSYFLGGPANDLNIATRWYPRTEVVNNLVDKFQIALRKFGFKAKGAAKGAATLFVEQMIEKGAWSTKANEFGGTMHQFQLETYRTELAALQAADPLVAEAAAGGETFWADKFAALTA
jgi:hypothetical protein